ncbi:MAG: hypothetical protein AAF804_18935 [Bacteroidota bacterium]
MKRLYFFLFLLTVSGSLGAQSKNQLSASIRVGVLSLDCQGLDYEPSTLGSVVRLELQKIQEFEVIDRYDMLDLLDDQPDQIDVSYCYSKRCLIEAGTLLSADQMVSGSVEKIGDKILITLKLVSVKARRVLRTEVGEYIDQSRELQIMIKLTLNKLLDKTNDPTLVEKLSYFSTLEAVPSTRIVNNGPRMGVAYLTGGMAERLGAPLEQGGYAARPFLTQFGYQQEIQYMSAGHFQALVEVIGFVSGLDQSLFIPSLIFLNGFRENRFGFEFGFGPSIALRRMADGFYDDQGAWRLAREWNQTDDLGDLLPIEGLQRQMDSRGDVEVFSRWVWAVGKTFRSGYLNIPVNLYVSTSRSDVMYGISVGFNLQRRSRR